jgi:hypothetical protein
MAGTSSFWCLHNARSALNALWTADRPRAAWLPAYVCGDVVQAVPQGVSIRYFAVDDELQPDVNRLSSDLRAGDHVLAVDYFGRPPARAFQDLVAARRDVRWVEDRAQALDCGPAWGDWLLYSPRKLIGVPDGGILIPTKAVHPLPMLQTEPLTDFGFIAPSLERFEDPEELQNAGWYERYVHAEATMSPGRFAMSRLSAAILKGANVNPHVERRQANYRTLHARLERWSFLKEGQPDFVPLGFPIAVPNAAQLGQRLSQQRIFAARHWKSLPSHPDEHENAHRLAHKLITLPCDYRYTSSDMDLVADAVIEALSS